ncbi:MAG: hypothetical protein DMG34_07070 [Acidobacteria bacterium]|nr:MAG: hypothetical protein DMG34_07070 [Acidobacteriota bacterium]
MVFHDSGEGDNYFAERSEFQKKSSRRVANVEVPEGYSTHVNSLFLRQVNHHVKATRPAGFGAWLFAL